MGGGDVASAHFADGQDVTAGFDFGILHAELTHVVAPADFEPDQVVGVVYDAHGVRFGVSDPQLALGYERHSGAPVHVDQLVLSTGRLGWPNRISS